jgi:ribosomal protein S18 acetylase RimI-like enzyme
MKQASLADKQTIIKILSESFDTNLSVNSVVKQDKKRVKRIRALMSYVFDIGFRIGQVYVSDNAKAAVICNFPDENKAKFKEDMRLAFQVVGLDRVFTVLKRENYIQSQHPKEPFIHLWFIGTALSEQGKGLGSQLMKELLSLNKYEELPVCLETSNPRNLPFYEKLGFMSITRGRGMIILCGL